MSGRTVRHFFGSRLFQASMLVASLGLSACTQVDNMFDSDSAPPARAQSVAMHATPRDRVKAASARCDAISDERTWLDCYYGAAQPVRGELGLAPASAAQQKLVPPPSNSAP